MQGVTGKAKLPLWHRTASTLWRKASAEQIEAVTAQMARDQIQEVPDDDEEEQSSPETYQR